MPGYFDPQPDHTISIDQQLQFASAFAHPRLNFLHRLRDPRF